MEVYLLCSNVDLGYDVLRAFADKQMADDICDELESERRARYMAWVNNRAQGRFLTENDLYNLGHAEHFVLPIQVEIKVKGQGA